MSKKKKIIIILVALSVVYIATRGVVYLIAKHNMSPKLSLTDTLVKKAEVELGLHPDKIDNYLILSNAYLQKVRETADSSYYLKIDDLLDKAQKLDPNYAETYLIRSTVAAGRHHFAEALEAGKKALALNSQAARYYAIVSDAQIETGMYKEAAISLQKMVDLRPDFSSYSRISHLRELYGQLEGAIQAMQSAIDAGAGFNENIAWAYVELGKLYFPKDLDKAQQQFNFALQIVPDYARAYQGLARVALAHGDTKKALEYFKKAYNLLPIAEHATDLGDMYKVLGRQDQANQYYELVKVGYQQFEKSGVKVDLEEALFLADHDLDLDNALVRARIAYKDRPSIYGADALAWALYKKQDYVNATKYSKESLRLGTKDALLYYHAGMIAKASADKILAKQDLEKAMNLNPNFSVLHSH